MHHQKSLIIGLFLGLVATPAIASENPLDDFSVGFELNEFHQDFGFGGHITSPFFASDYLALRLRGGISWIQGVVKSPPNAETEWHSYTPIRLGIVNRGYLTETMRVYSEGGALIILPSSAVSEHRAYGGYGVFGFEFLMGKDSPVSYFLELGAQGTGAVATDLEGHPIYANGFVTTDDTGDL